MDTDTALEKRIDGRLYTPDKGSAQDMPRHQHLSGFCQNNRPVHGAIDTREHSRSPHPPPFPFLRKAARFAHALRSMSSPCIVLISWAPPEPDMVLLLKWHVQDGGPQAMHFGGPQWTMDTVLLGTSLPWQSGLRMGVAWVEQASWTRTCHLSKGLTGAYTCNCDDLSPL